MSANHVLGICVLTIYGDDGTTDVDYPAMNLSITSSLKLTAIWESATIMPPTSHPPEADEAN